MGMGVGADAISRRNASLPAPVGDTSMASDSLPPPIVVDQFRCSCRLGDRGGERERAWGWRSSFFRANVLASGTAACAVVWTSGSSTFALLVRPPSWILC